MKKDLSFQRSLLAATRIFMGNCDLTLHKILIFLYYFCIIFKWKYKKMIGNERVSLPTIEMKQYASTEVTYMSIKIMTSNVKQKNEKDRQLCFHYCLFNHLALIN